MNEHHAPKNNGRFHQMSSAVPASTPIPVLKATTTTANIVSAAATATVAAAAAAAFPSHAAAAHAAQSMTYDERRPSDKTEYPVKKSSDERRPFDQPPRKAFDRGKSFDAGADYRKKSSELGKGSAINEDDDDDDEEDEDEEPVRRRDSFSMPVNPDDVLRFLQKSDAEDEPRSAAQVGTTMGRRDRLAERKLKSSRPPATKDLYVDNEKIKLNRSYKLRYNFMRQQAAVPSSMQKHMERFKKPPFKRVWKPGWCVDNISDRLARLREKRQKP